MKVDLARIKRTYTILFGIALFAFIVRLITGQFSFQFNIILFATSIAILTVSWETLRFINLYLNRVFPFERGIAARITLQLIMGVVVALIIRFVLQEFGEPVLPYKLDNLFLAATWLLYVLMTIGINSIFFIQFFIGKWKDSIVKNERLEKEKSQLQFDNLKNQLNPHFLFNSLTSLHSLIGEDQKLAAKFLQHLSKVYRYVLQQKETSSVSLKTEIEFIQNYIYLLETRFNGALRINLSIDNNKTDKQIVPVTLQVLIENAIKHNVTDVAKPLSIDILTSGDYLVVSNNLQLRSVVENSNKIGLENLKSVYGFLSSERVEIEQTEDRFYVKVPLL